MTPDEFEPIRVRIWDELVNLRDAWDHYEFLFGESPERIRMLNACAGWFFQLAQRLLLRDTILGISRLTDPTTMGGFENLVISSLLSDPALDTLPTFRPEVETAIEQAISAATRIRTHRNKYIAHLDKRTAIGSSAEPLPGLTRASISASIGKLEAAYSLHSNRVRNADPDFTLHALGSGKALVKILEQSDRWKKYQKLHPH